MRIKQKLAYKFAITVKAWYNTVQMTFFYKKREGEVQ